MAFSYERPGSVEGVLKLLSEAPVGSVAVLAGGTDLLLDIETGHLRPQRVVSLAGIPWTSIDRRGDELVIGSLAPLRRLEQHPGLAADLPGLLDGVRAVGSPALRQRATLGGNIVRAAASSDLLPILLALDAVVEVVGPGGARDRPLGELLEAPRRPALAPTELIRAVRVPAVAPSSYVWQRVRPSHDISQVGVAVGRPARAAAWRVALAGVAPVPARAPAAEAFLSAERPAPEDLVRAAAAAAETAPFLTDRRATEPYRRLLVRALTVRALAGATGVAPPPGAPT